MPRTQEQRAERGLATVSPGPEQLLRGCGKGDQLSKEVTGCGSLFKTCDLAKI